VHRATGAEVEGCGGSGRLSAILKARQDLPSTNHRLFLSVGESSVLRVVVATGSGWLGSSRHSGRILRNVCSFISQMRVVTVRSPG